MRSTLVALFSLFLTACGSDKPVESAKPVALQVAVQAVAKANVDLTKEFVGQTKGAIDAEVRARVEGVVVSMHFEEGKEVKEGQLLYKIDPAPYLAKVSEAKAKLSQAETLLVKAQQDLGRVRPLAAIKALSQKDLDSAIAQEGAAQGAVSAAKASVESAEIELSYCDISAPTAGIIGLTKAKVGEFVGRAPNPTILNTVSKLDPIHVLFSVTEKEYLYFARMKQKEIENGEQPAPRSIQMVLADGSAWDEAGSVASISREVDPKTGSLSVEAAFPNKGNFLRPGQFAKLKVVAEKLNDVLVVPQKAIKQLQGIDQVFVVKADKTVELKNIKLGVASDQMRVVEEGLNEGDLVVVEGLQQLKPGALVNF